MRTADRPLLPHIYRSWNARKAAFVWTCTPVPSGNWGLGVSQQARYDWRQALAWCHRQNAAPAGA